MAKVALLAHPIGLQEKTPETRLVGSSGFQLASQMSRQERKETILEGGKAVTRIFGPYQTSDFQYVTLPDSLWPYRVPRETVLVTMGERAFHEVYGSDHMPLAKARGYIFGTGTGQWLIPTLHPQDLRAEPAEWQTLLWDLDKAFWLAGQSGFRHEAVVGDRHWGDFVAGYVGGPLALDIETPYKHDVSEDDLGFDDPTFNIDSISFAYTDASHRERVMSVPWDQYHLSGVRALVEAAMGRGLTCIHNVDYDRPRVEANLQVDLPLARVRDTMDSWHCLYNALPRGLGYITSCFPLGHHWTPAWKNLGSGDEQYQLLDALMLLRNYHSILALLDATGQRPVYDLMCVALDPQLDLMERGGLLVDEPMRARVAEELGATQARLTAALDNAVPEAVKSFQTWKSLRAAEAGINLLRARREIAEGAALKVIPGTRKANRCAKCGCTDVKPDHAKRKTLKDAPNAAMPELQ